MPETITDDDIMAALSAGAGLIPGGIPPEEPDGRIHWHDGEPSVNLGIPGDTPEEFAVNFWRELCRPDFPGCRKTA